jgi:hypothetical protein
LPEVIDIESAVGESGSTVAVSQPQYGGAQINSDGSLTYTQGSAFPGQDSFSYTVCSGTLSATGTISIINRGSFNGLVTNASPTPANTGGFQLTLGAGGKFTGKLALGAGGLSFRGTFATNGETTVNIAASGGQPAVTLNLDLATATGLISGTMSTTTDASSVTAEITPYSQTNKAPEAGAYTVTLPPEGNPPAGTDAPQGTGTLRLVVNADGTAWLVGVLADSTIVSVSAPLAEDGSLSFYEPLYGKQGYLSGVLAFQSIATSGSGGELSGPVQWQCPANSASSTYPAGFTTNITATGSTYSVSASESEESSAILPAGQ